MDPKQPHLIDRALFCDDRGHFENIPLSYPELGFEGKRVYICSNFEQGMVRGFHFHEFESKIFICLQGAAKFMLFEECRYAIDITEETRSETLVISASLQKGIYVPAKYANGWRSLTSDTVLLGISNRTVEESQQDDWRFCPDCVVWDTEWR